MNRLVHIPGIGLISATNACQSEILDLLRGNLEIVFAPAVFFTKRKRISSQNECAARGAAGGVAVFDGEFHRY